MRIEWWPTAPGGAWDGTPAFYLGGLVLALLPIVVTSAIARLTGAPSRPSNRLMVGTGLLVVTLNWPVAEMATASLAFRTVQYLATTLAAAPLILLGIPRWRAAGRGQLRRGVERALGAPIAGAAVLGLVVWTTHFGPVVDAAGRSISVDAAIRTGWLMAAIWFWWPLVGPGPERERLSYLAGLGYLILPFALPKFPAAVWVFSADPVYEAYAGVAHPFEWSHTADQGVAGFILWFPGSVMVAVALYLLIRHWVREDRRLSLRQRLGVPADPEAVSSLLATPETWAALEALVAMMDEVAPPRAGSDLTYVADGGRIVLQLHFAGTEEEQATILAQVSAYYAAYLQRYDGPRAEAVRARLDVAVVPYGVRVR